MLADHIGFRIWFQEMSEDQPSVQCQSGSSKQQQREHKHRGEKEHKQLWN